MAAKAADGRMSHLLIDRFRFDSFAPAGKESRRLLTRFGDLVYMFFMITPPEMTVERAWKRGLKFGRYKAVDDLLAHNVEALRGHARIVLHLGAQHRTARALRISRQQRGGRPATATVAYGWNQEMTILDVKAMLDIDRFRKININAQAPGEVYVGDNLAPDCNVDFLKRCARMIPVINFADYDTGHVYARLDTANGSGATRTLSPARRETPIPKPGWKPSHRTNMTRPRPKYLSNRIWRTTRHTRSAPGARQPAPIEAGIADLVSSGRCFVNRPP